MRYVADANVMLPLLMEGHAHRKPALDWWEGCGDTDVALCLPVRMGILRLLTNVRVMGASALRPVQAWDVMDQLIDDPRISLIDQTPQALAGHWRANIARREPTPNLWTDAWLAAMAQATDSEMVTFDKGFRSFVNLRLQLLVSQADERRA